MTWFSAILADITLLFLVYLKVCSNMSNTLINYIKQHNRFLKLSIDCFMKCNAFHITCCIDMDRFSTTSKAVILVTIYIVLCLASFPDRISQSGVIDVEISDDQLIYCIVNVNERKIKFQKKKKMQNISLVCR